MPGVADLRRAAIRHLPFAIIFLATVPLSGQSIPSPTDHFGHEIGADRRLVHWDRMVEYFRMVGTRSDRVNVRELGKSTDGRPFLLLEISSPATVADIDRYRALQQRLYFQDHMPGQNPDLVHTEEERRELFEDHKAVLLITCSIHATEVGAAQMSLRLVHELATSNDPRIGKILDNTILLLVPSLNPDGQAMVVEWYDQYVGTPFEGGSLPWLYQRYVGHDNNRDAYMFTQQETRLIGQVLWREWFPSIWLDEHQMGSRGARIFVMPATDPINNNVHPLIYRLNGIFGQAQAAALEEAGKVGIIYDQTYTNFWPGAMAWTGWWHNQVGMLTELASVRIATPTVQEPARPGVPPQGSGGEGRGSYSPGTLQPPPTDVQPRTNYPRPWLGGLWTLRDIVDYEYIVSLATLEAAADGRERLNRQIYGVNRTTIQQFLAGEAAGGPTNELGGYGPLPPRVVEERPGTGRVMPGALGAGGTPYAVVFPPDEGDPVARAILLQLMERAGVRVEEARRPFSADGVDYPAGTFLIRLAQVFGRYAKEMLETQVYPEVRLAPDLPPLPPYDVTAWSLGLQMGVGAHFVDHPFEASLRVVEGVPLPPGGVEGRGDVYLVSPESNNAFAAVNRLWGEGARVRRAEEAVEVVVGGTVLPPGTFVVEGIPGETVRAVAEGFGVTVHAVLRNPSGPLLSTPKPRIALYQPWQSNMDEGWTRWVLEAYGFEYTVLHPQDLRAAAAVGVGPDGEYEIDGELRSRWPPHVGDRAPDQVLAEPLADRFDVILFAHQSGESILEGSNSSNTPEEYRMGLGKEGLAALEDFVEEGGRIVALGSATGLFTARWPVPVTDASAGLSSDDFLIPGSIVRLQVDPKHPLAWGMPEETHGFFSRNPFFQVETPFPSQEVKVAVRYPNEDLRASGWLRGEEHLAGKAAAVEVSFPPETGNERRGSLVLLGIRPQHRAQTHATFKLLFNALVNPGLE